MRIRRSSAEAGITSQLFLSLFLLSLGFPLHTRAAVSSGCLRQQQRGLENYNDMIPATADQCTGCLNASYKAHHPAHCVVRQGAALTSCRDVTVLVLDRPRHEQIIKEVREAGARIKLISDGDVGGAIEVAKLGAPVDVLLGIGGTPEGDPLGH